MELISKLSTNMSVECKEQGKIININTLECVLTPLTCASLISEIIKCLIFEKSIIPYPYNWLKSIAENKLKLEQDSKSFNENRQHRLATAAFDCTENIINNIKKIFQFGNNIAECMVLIGTTPLNPKEVYRIKIPTIAKGHIESNHYNMISKFQPKILRSLLLSEEWMSKCEQATPFTNLFVFLKIEDGKSFFVDSRTSENFIPSPLFYIPQSVQCFVINLFYDDSTPYNCCSNLTIYHDRCINNKEEKEKVNGFEIVKSDSELFEINVDWMQASYILKGFGVHF